MGHLDNGRARCVKHPSLVVAAEALGEASCIDAFSSHSPTLSVCELPVQKPTQWNLPTHRRSQLRSLISSEHCCHHRFQQNADHIHPHLQRRQQVRCLVSKCHIATC